MSVAGEQELKYLRAQVTELTAIVRWERTQKERLLEEMGGHHREIRRLQDRLTDLEFQLAERKPEPAPS